MENHLDRLMSSHDEARRLLYIRPSVPVPQSAISGPRDDTLTVRRGPMDLGTYHHHHQQQHPHQHQLHQRIHSSLTKRPEPMPGQSSAVSRRNARERKRVRLVNLGFSTLRERVPPGTKNKKLSKVETLRAAIDYIRQLQHILGIPEQDEQNIVLDENYDCSSVASSEEVMVVQAPCGPPSGSTEHSPASSHPSDCSLVSSPYAPQHTQEDQLLDMGVWFS